MVLAAFLNAWLRDRSPLPLEDQAVAWVDHSAALDLEPMLNPDIRGALYYPDNQQLMPRDLLLPGTARTAGRRTTQVRCRGPLTAAPYCRSGR